MCVCVCVLSDPEMTMQDVSATQTMQVQGYGCGCHQHHDPGFKVPELLVQHRKNAFRSRFELKISNLLSLSLQPLSVRAGHASFPKEDRLWMIASIRFPSLSPKDLG